MSNSDKFPQGIANARDNVGRNLYDHPAIGVNFDADEEIWPARRPVSPCSIDQFRDGDFRREHAPFRIDIVIAGDLRGLSYGKGQGAIQRWPCHRQPAWHYL